MLNIFVIASKYNDIFYSQFTEEWSSASKKYLIYLNYTNNFNLINSSFIENFDEIIYINPKKFYDVLKILAFSLQHRNEKSTFITSNMTLFICKTLYKLINPQFIVMIEDGVGSYINTMKQHLNTGNKTKAIAQNILNIDDEEINKKVKKLYLLNPNIAQIPINSYITKLNVKAANTPAEIEQKLHGKKILIGQPLYNIKYINLSVDNYNHYINDFIKKYNIDFYIPHQNSSIDEDIKTEIYNLSEYGFTLEMLATNKNLSFDIYAFTSSTLISLKTINHKIKTISLSINETKSINDINDRLNIATSVNFVEKHVDQIIRL